jgi:hypothetical protein
MANIHYLTGVGHWMKVLGDPVPNYARDGYEWTLDFTPDAESLDKVRELGLEKKLKNKGDDRGDFLALKQKEKTVKGKLNDPITVVDARNRLWDPDVKIGNKSKIEVKLDVVDYGKAMPTGLYVRAIRVLDLVPFVRQEFAPLPEESEYVQKLEEFPEVSEVMAEIAAEDDPLNVED